MSRAVMLVVECSVTTATMISGMHGTPSEPFNNLHLSLYRYVVIFVFLVSVKPFTVIETVMPLNK